MPGVISRVQTVIGGILGSSYGPTETHREQLAIAERAYQEVESALRAVVDVDVPALGARLDDLGIRWSTGRGAPGG